MYMIILIAAHDRQCHKKIAICKVYILFQQHFFDTFIYLNIHNNYYKSLSVNSNVHNTYLCWFIILVKRQFFLNTIIFHMIISKHIYHNPLPLCFRWPTMWFLNNCCNNLRLHYINHIIYL